MYFMYVDDTGDPGNNTDETSHFGLVGLVVHSSYWSQYLDELVEFRRRMRALHGLKLKDDIHAKNLISKPRALSRIPKYKRLEILHQFLSQLSSMDRFRVLGVLIDKRDKPVDYPFFERAWTTLIQRFENTIAANNFPAPEQRNQNSGLIFPDRTDLAAVRKVFRRMRRYNPIPNAGGHGYRDIPVTRLLEDPNERQAAFSYFIQASDVAAYFLYQSVNPNSYIRQKQARNYYAKLSPIFCRECSSDPWGIVRL